MERIKEPTSQVIELRIGPMGQFALKTAIVSVAIVVSGWILLDILDDFASRRMQQLEATIRAATVIGGREFWTKLDVQLDSLADPRTDISPEKKQKIISQIRIISDRWRPFLAEAGAAVAGESSPPPK
jgi:hypothetical protein